MCCLHVKDQINGSKGEKDQKLLPDKVIARIKLGGEETLDTNDKKDNISLYSVGNCQYRQFRSCKVTRRLRSISIPHCTCNNLVTTIKMIVLSFGCTMNEKQEQKK